MDYEEENENLGVSIDESTPPTNTDDYLTTDQEETHTSTSGIIYEKSNVHDPREFTPTLYTIPSTRPISCGRLANRNLS
ncbi:MAG: hypothetical protein AAES65_19140 [Candidatus Thiodiazotropha sp. (ex. Lucinoma kazani)]